MYQVLYRYGGSPVHVLYSYLARIPDEIVTKYENSKRSVESTRANCEIRSEQNDTRERTASACLGHYHTKHCTLVTATMTATQHHAASSGSQPFHTELPHRCDFVTVCAAVRGSPQ